MNTFKIIITLFFLLPLTSQAEMQSMHNTMHDMHHEEPAHEMTDPAAHPNHDMMPASKMMPDHKMIMEAEAPAILNPIHRPSPYEEEMHMNHQNKDAHTRHQMMVPQNASATTKAFLEANHQMHMGMNIEFTGNADIDFLRGMIPHHEGAVAMSKIELENGKAGNMRELAGRIITVQEYEINLMKRALESLEKNWNGEINQNHPSIRANKMVNHKMHEGMNIKFTDQVDIDFAKGMIPHHQGALDMARVVIEHGDDPRIKQFAYKIINAQTTEITFMQRWLKRVNTRNSRGRWN